MRSGRARGGARTFDKVYIRRLDTSHAATKKFSLEGGGGETNLSRGERVQRVVTHGEKV